MTVSISARRTFQTILFRIAGLFALQAAWIFILKSALVADLMGRTLAGRLHYGAEPMYALALLCAGILVCIRQEPDVTWGRYSRPVLIAATGSWLLLAGLSLLLTYPPAPWHTIFDGMDGTALRPSVYAALRYSVIMCMSVPALFFFFPPAFLRANRMLFFMTGGALAGYMWLSILRIAVHTPMASVVLRASYGVLKIVSDDTSMNPGQLTLQSGSFSAVIGPQCLGMDSIILFLAAWPFAWYLASRTRHISSRRAGIGLVAGLIILLFLNIIRIALIMLAGSVLPQKGVDLFHGSMGAILFFAVLVALLPLLREDRQ